MAVIRFVLRKPVGVDIVNFVVHVNGKIKGLSKLINPCPAYAHHFKYSPARAFH
jgi:hypothetical protein